MFKKRFNRRWKKNMSSRGKRRIFKRGRRMNKLNYPKASRGGFRI